jgi:hypothetical protein
MNTVSPAEILRAAPPDKVADAVRKTLVVRAALVLRHSESLKPDARPTERSEYQAILASLWMTAQVGARYAKCEFGVSTELYRAASALGLKDDFGSARRVQDMIRDAENAWEGWEANGAEAGALPDYLILSQLDPQAFGTAWRAARNAAIAAARPMPLFEAARG